MDKMFGDENRKDVLFRTVFRGYDKQDVNDYIVSLVRSNQSDAEVYSSHIRSLEEERTENAGKIVELSERNKVLTGLVQAEAEARLEIEKEAGEYRAQRDKAETELKALKKQLVDIRGDMENIMSIPDTLQADYTREVQALNGEIEKLMTRLEMKNAEIDAKNAELEEKEAEIKDLKAKLDGLAVKHSKAAEEASAVDAAIAASVSSYGDVRKSLERLESILNGLEG